MVGIAGHRTALTLSGKRAANSFGTDGKDISELSSRMCRAYANCTENLPIFIGVVAVAILSDNAAITDPLVFVVVASRLLQSTVHMISTSAAAVSARFTFFAIQCGVLAWWIFQLARVAIG